MLVSPGSFGKPFKSLGAPSKITPVSQVSLKDGEKILFDEKANKNSFKNFYANLALNLVNKLSHALINLIEIQFWLTIKDF